MYGFAILSSMNYRQTMQFAESGNADAAIVSWTLVHDRGGILIPETLHQPIRQAAAIVSASKNRGDAAAFLNWLISPKAQEILHTHGLK